MVSKDANGLTLAQEIPVLLGQKSKMEKKTYLMQI